MMSCAADLPRTAQACRPRDDAALERLRQAAAERFAASGWPRPHHPSLRHTPLQALDCLADEGAAVQPPRSTTVAQIEALVGKVAGTGPVLVFIDGELSEPLSHADSEGLAVRPLAQLGEATAPHALGRLAALSDEPLVALNGARLAQGVGLSLAGQWPAEQLLQLIFVATTAAAAQPRVVVEVAAGARTQLVERHLSLLPEQPGAGTNLVVETFVGAGAEHSHLIVHAADHPVVAQHLTEVEGGGLWQAYALQLGGAWARQLFDVRLAGEGSACQLGGAAAGAERDVADVQATVRHLAPRTRSDQIFRGTFEDGSLGIFGGMVAVAEGAAGAAARQLSRSLLLSPRASAHTQPQMEILTDDVRCSHGATIGQLDADALFFLQARGLHEAEARRLLAASFLAQSLAALTHPQLLKLAAGGLHGHLVGAQGEGLDGLAGGEES